MKVKTGYLVATSGFERPSTFIVKLSFKFLFWDYLIAVKFKPIDYKLASLGVDTRYCMLSEVIMFKKNKIVLEENYDFKQLRGATK